MTNEEKELLLKDLCTRLPYGIIVQYKQKTFYPYGEYTVDTKVEIDEMLHHRLKLLDCKPYLRPMSSMNIEEGERLEHIAKETLGDFMFEAEEDGGAIYHMTKWKTLSPAMFDYLNSIHIDYRGLIGKGLALEAPERMYNN